MDIDCHHKKPPGLCYLKRVEEAKRRSRKEKVKEGEEEDIGEA